MRRAIAALLGLTVCACDPVWNPPDLATAGSPITITGAGPTGVTASATVVDQIDVHWSAVDTAFKYYVLQSANGGAFQIVASTIAPATAEAITDLVGGVRYCYEVVAAFASGAQSEPSAQVCAVALGDGAVPPHDTTKTTPPTSFQSSTWSFQVGPNAMTSNTSGILVGGVPMHGGDVVRSVAFPIRGTGDITAAVKVADAMMSETVIGVAQATTSQAGWSVVNIDVTDTTIPAGGALTMIFTASRSGLSLGDIATSYTTTTPTSSVTAPLSTAITYITVPSSLFAQPNINVGVNAQVSQLPLATGQIASASIAAQCTSSGFILACARVRERGTWDWCSSPVACSGPTSAVVPLPAPITVGPTAHVDIALMSGPTVATSPFGVYTVQ